MAVNSETIYGAAVKNMEMGRYFFYYIPLASLIFNWLSFVTWFQDYPYLPKSFISFIIVSGGLFASLVEPAIFNVADLLHL